MIRKITDKSACLPSLNGYKLYEALLLKNGKYRLFHPHTKRLMKSAAYFSVLVTKQKVVQTLLAFARRFGRGSFKVRLFVDATGKMTVSGKGIVLCRDSAPRCPTGRVELARVIMNSADIFLRHKTTHREIYDREYKKYLKKGFYDVIFFNERRELTEAHSSNIFIKKNNIFYTPPVSCGLLPGTYRDFLLAKGGKYKEKVLYKKDLIKADTVYICNSVRGMRRVGVFNSRFQISSKKRRLT